MDNLKAIVEEAGLESVVKTTVYIQNMSDFATANEIYGRYFQENAPGPALRFKNGQGFFG